MYVEVATILKWAVTLYLAGIISGLVLLIWAVSRSMPSRV